MWGCEFFGKMNFAINTGWGGSALHPKNDMDVTVMKAISYHM